MCLCGGVGPAYRPVWLLASDSPDNLEYSRLQMRQHDLAANNSVRCSRAGSYSHHITSPRWIRQIFLMDQLMLNSEGRRAAQGWMAWIIVCPECPSSLPDRCNRSTRSFSERRAPTQASAVITPARDGFITHARSLKSNLAQRHLREATDSASGVGSAG